MAKPVKPTVKSQHAARFLTFCDDLKDSVSRSAASAASKRPLKPKGTFCERNAAFKFCFLKKTDQYLKGDWPHTAENNATKKPLPVSKRALSIIL